ncbi:heat stress transcription factor C-1a-like [Panicum miliaceum]|uniref:Heat stress transcription factor C-1a-like n=1 Tax=Panicum miliaceum TaxID=4540 RepID=A0A3L6SP98_PANMI|nr:heat stress transcription factor C-1a-like [Panicum miliaceum]
MGDFGARVWGIGVSSGRREGGCRRLLRSSAEEEAWGAPDDRGGDSGRRERAETAAAAAGRAAGLVFRQGRSKGYLTFDHHNGHQREKIDTDLPQLLTWHAKSSLHAGSESTRPCQMTAHAPDFSLLRPAPVCQCIPAPSSPPLPATFDSSPLLQTAAFVAKTYQMVCDPRTDALVRWGRDNKSFVVADPAGFSRLLLPCFFKHSDFSSFVRQLNTYGFRKVHPDRWEFAHESFLRGQTHLLPRIVRRKKRGEGAASPCSAGGGGDAQCAAGAIGGEDRRHQEDQLDDQEEREALLEEVQRLRREQTAIGEELAQMSRRLQATERRPDQLMSFLASPRVARHTPTRSGRRWRSPSMTRARRPGPRAPPSPPAARPRPRWRWPPPREGVDDERDPRQGGEERSQGHRRSWRAT